MDENPLVLVHGYGVRGFFWSALRPELAAAFDRIEAPDFELQSIEQGVHAVSHTCTRLRSEARAPVTLVGHSLGGVLSALAARDLSAEVVSHLVVIAAPFGERVGRAFGPLVRLRFALGLVGKDELRRRFFGPAVPDELQQRVFDSAADESAELKALGRRRRWFHTDSFPHGVPQRCLVIAAESDRIVDVRETAQFARALGAEFVRIPASEQVGHDDFGVYPPVARRTATKIIEFVTEG
jgi:predicted alpha/beta hydrolase family esterase